MEWHSNSIIIFHETVQFIGLDGVSLLEQDYSMIGLVEISMLRPSASFDLYYLHVNWNESGTNGCMSFASSN